MPRDDDRYDRETWGSLIAVGLLLLIVVVLVGYSVYVELRTPW